MKITVLIHDRPKYRGGPIVNMLRLLPALAERGHEINVIGLFDREAPNLKHLEVEYGICHTQLPPSIRFTPSRVRWLIHKVKTLKPDLFVPNSFCEGLYASREIQLAGIPCLGYLRNLDDFHHAIIEEFVACEHQHAPSGFACVSEELRSLAEKYLPEGSNQRLFFLPSGVPIPKQTTKHNSGSLTACYVGRFVDKQKRFTETTLALLQALKSKTLTRVGFFGSGHLSGWLSEEINSRGLQEVATIHGPVSPENLSAQISNYHLSILLSDYEGTPGALMDTMAHGLIPVTTSIPGGTHELVQHRKTGIICSDRGEGFQCALLELKSSLKLRLELGKNARDKIESNYSLEQTVERFEHIVETLQLAGGPTSSKRNRIRQTFKVREPSMKEFVRQPWDRSSSLKDAALCEYSIRIAPAINRLKQRILPPET